jgi:transposase
MQFSPYNAGMFTRPCYKKSNGKKLAYWALVESYRTANGPRQRVVAYLGQLKDSHRKGVQQAAEGKSKPEFVQARLFNNDQLNNDQLEPEWVEINASGVRVENEKSFGGPWLALQLVKQLGLDEFLRQHLPPGEEHVAWPLVSLILVICRLLNPSSELHIAEHYYKSTALSDLLGVANGDVYDNRLYRGLDKLLPKKDELETYLKNKLGDLFDLEFDILLYDVTSTYFEGQCNGNSLAKHGHSRDHRGDCKQVCIGLVVTKDGIPLGYEVFAGNTHDSKTYRQIIETMERKYGKADRIWCSDRGMTSESNIEFLKQDGRKFIIGTAKSELRNFERELLAQDWNVVREGLEVKLCPRDGELFVLCRSADRREKEKAMHERFVVRMEKELEKVRAGCEKRRCKKEVIDRRVGRIKSQNSRGAGLFDIKVEERDGRATIVWTKRDSWRDWATLSEGCYLLRTNVAEWSAEDLWRAYIQLTEAEAAFRIEKNDLRIRPIWHQKEERVLSHILVCFLAYVLWRTLGCMVKSSGLGDEPRRVLNELSKINLMDVVLPTTAGTEIRKRCITRPTEHQQILLQHLGLNLPRQFKK